MYKGSSTGNSQSLLDVKWSKGVKSYLGFVNVIFVVEFIKIVENNGGCGEEGEEDHQQSIDEDCAHPPAHTW